MQHGYSGDSHAGRAISRDRLMEILGPSDKPETDSPAAGAARAPIPFAPRASARHSPTTRRAMGRVARALDDLIENAS